MTYIINIYTLFNLKLKQNNILIKCQNFQIYLQREQAYKTPK